MSFAFNPFDVVGVKSGASLDEIKAAFRSQALTLHPDKGGDPEKFRRLQEAYEILKRDFNPDGTRRGVTTGASASTYTSKAASPGRSPLDDFEEFFKTVFGGVGRHGVSRPTQAETVDEYFARVEAARAKTNGEPAKPKEPVQPPKPPTVDNYSDSDVRHATARARAANARNYESQSAQATDNWRRKYEEGRREAKETRDRERAQREAKEAASRAERLKRAQEQAERYRRRTTISNIEDAIRWLADFNAQVTFTERGHVQVQIWVDRPRPCVVEREPGDEPDKAGEVRREIFYAFDRTMVDSRGPNLLEATRAAALDAMRYTAL